MISYFGKKILIMQTGNIKNIFGFTLATVVLASSFFFNTADVHALSCAPPEHFFVGAYEQGKFTGGFAVEPRGTGRMCDTRPVVSERTENLQSIFTTASQKLNKVISSGVYQLSAQCWPDKWNERCFKNIKLEQLSANSTELARYKSEWQEKERDGLRAATTQLWLIPVIIVAIVALALFWPWILVKIWPNLRRRLSVFLIIAILLQAPIALILLGLQETFIWSYGLWQTTASIFSIVLVLSIVGEIIFFIVRKIRSRNVTKVS